MPNNNKGSQNAKDAKKNEFYTQLSDIENELRHYRDFFKDKVVFCNCDDPYESNFFKYFAMNFNTLHLKKLISTCYAESTIQCLTKSLENMKEGDRLTFVLPKDRKRAYKIEINEVKDYNEDGKVDLLDVEYLIRNDANTLQILDKDGDFRSQECVDILKSADVVVTNPPFSLFKEFVAQLMKYKKKFLIIGNQNAITYKEIFPLIRDNKIWLGYNFKGNVGFFSSPYEDHAKSSQHKDGLIRVSGVMWFTNIEHNKRHQKLDLYNTYSPEKYPKYDNYDAIDVSRVKEIPVDYDGVMGVPITFLDKFCPEQFEIVGEMVTTKVDGFNYGYPYVHGKRVYARLLIKRKDK